MGRTRWSLAPVTAQVRAIFPVFWGICGSTRTIFKEGIAYPFSQCFVIAEIGVINKKAQASFKHDALSGVGAVAVCGLDCKLQE